MKMSGVLAFGGIGGRPRCLFQREPVDQSRRRCNSSADNWSMRDIPESARVRSSSAKLIIAERSVSHVHFFSCLFAGGSMGTELMPDASTHLFTSSAIAPKFSNAVSRSTVNVLGNDMWRGEVRGFFQGVVLQPEDVEVHLVALGQ